MTKRVSFSHINVAPFEIPSDAEKVRRWFTNADFCSFQDDRKACIKAVKLADGDLEQLDHNMYCIRGLEDKISVDHYKEKICKRNAVIRMILRTQQLQKEQKKPDAEYLKMISIMCSQMAKNQALAMARSDELSCDRPHRRCGSKRDRGENQESLSLPCKRFATMEAGNEYDQRMGST